LFPLSGLADTVLVAGSNRGIGFELAKQFSEQGWDVIATSRSPDDDTALQALAVGNENIVIEHLDLTDHPAIDALVDKLSGTPIDILLNNRP
jgi:NAD(P)-dependent dehydrogenase (short-subunit alcohol dehydrogenase family)